MPSDAPVITARGRSAGLVMHRIYSCEDGEASFRMGRLTSQNQTRRPRCTVETNRPLACGPIGDPVAQSETLWRHQRPR